MIEGAKPPGGDAKPPLFSNAVAAGVPFQSFDDVDRALDLNELCVRHPAATYFVRAAGDSMTGAGIDDGDVLVVDRSLEALGGDIVVAAVDGAFTVKRLDLSRGRVRLVPENANHAPIELREGETCELFGVVTSVIHFFRFHG